MHVASTSLTEDAYTTIKENIIQGVYRPGQITNELELGEQLGMGRQPVRVAVHRLYEDGWLIDLSRHKIQVKKITEKDLREIYDIRNRLELSALKEVFVQNKTWDYSFAMEAHILKMRANIHDRKIYENYDLDFHSCLIDIYDNSRLKKFYNSNREEIIWANMLTKDDGSDISHFVDELTSIVNAMREKDFEKTYSLYKNHLDDGFMRISESLQKIYCE